MDTDNNKLSKYDEYLSMKVLSWLSLLGFAVLALPVLYNTGGPNLT